MLHAKADKSVYTKFFNIIKEKLGGFENTVMEFTGPWTSYLLIGSDEEKAMVSAAEDVFPLATFLRCARCVCFLIKCFKSPQVILKIYVLYRHAKNNAREHLKNTGKANAKQREAALNQVFDQAFGIIGAESEADFLNRCQNMDLTPWKTSYIQKLQDNIYKYHVMPRLFLNNSLNTYKWLNNIAESKCLSCHFLLKILCSFYMPFDFFLQV